MALKEYNYPEIIRQLGNLTPRPEHEAAIATIIYGLENNHRFHWINDNLMEDGEPSIYTILDYYNVTY